MNARRNHNSKANERGASLVLALAVMIAIGGILSGLVTFLMASNRVSNGLQSSRNRQYAADAAIEQAIRLVQDGPDRGLVGTRCSSASGTDYFTPSVGAINGYTIRVECRGVPAPRLDTLNRVVIERNVVFTACVGTANACTDDTTVIKAKVNFPTDAAGVVTGAFVQSWSVI